LVHQVGNQYIVNKILV